MSLAVEQVQVHLLLVSYPVRPFPQSFYLLTIAHRESWTFFSSTSTYFSEPTGHGDMAALDGRLARSTQDDIVVVSARKEEDTSSALYSQLWRACHNLARGERRVAQGMLDVEANLF